METHHGYLAAFDLDGTLLKKNSSYLFCQYLAKNKVFSRLDLHYCTLLYLRHCYLGLTLMQLHTSVFNRLFRGQPITLLNSWLERFLSENLESMWYEPACLRLKELQRQNVECMILSNAPNFIATAIGKRLGIDAVFATDYQSNDRGELSHLAFLMDGEAKSKKILERGQKTVAFSDSLLDLPFLEAAKIRVAVNPKADLRRYAKKQGWEIL